MSISSEISRISGNVSAALTAIGNKGVTVPQGSNSDDLATLIGSIQTGGGTSAISVVDTLDSHGGTVREITALDISDTTAIASVVQSPYWFYTAQGVKTQGTASSGGGGSTLVQKSITLNGTYDPDDDNADGYSGVTVNVQNGASMSETANTYGTTINITSAPGSAPSATRHTLYFEFEDETTETEYAYYDDSFISSAITATSPTTRNNKTVTLAELDGVTWYSYTPTIIPLNTQLIDYTAITSGYGIYDNGEIQETAGVCVSDYTVIDPSMTFALIGLEWFCINFYDSSKALIGTEMITNITGGGSSGTLSPSNIPSGSAWVRISALDNPDSTDLSLIRTA